MEYKDAVGVIESCAGFSDTETPVGEAWDIVLRRVARLEEALNEISTLYWVDAPAPEEMRRIARRALEEK